MSKTTVLAALALSSAFAFATVAAAQPDEVRVVYAQPFSYAAGGISWSEAYIFVHARNIGTPSSRHVYVHYDNGSSWVDEEMSLVGDYGDHSAYRITHPSPHVEFAVKYVTSAGTYWDNNDGADYAIQPYTSSGEFVPGVVGYEVGLTEAVVSDYAYFTGTGWALAAKLTVDVAVENLSYNKQVGIRYSVDGWATFHDVAGTFNYSVNTGGGSRIEYWSVAAYGLPPGGEIEYAIYYRNVDWGTEYWDNNFGQNYAHALTTGTEIR